MLLNLPSLLILIFGRNQAIEEASLPRDRGTPLKNHPLSSMGGLVTSDMNKSGPRKPRRGTPVNNVTVMGVCSPSIVLER